jgi:hypothetical protein
MKNSVLTPLQPAHHRIFLHSPFFIPAQPGELQMTPIVNDHAGALTRKADGLQTNS